VKPAAWYWTLWIVSGQGMPQVPGLRVVARIPLPGGNSRLDYASLDSARGLLFVAHLGASQVVEINIGTGRVVRAIGGLSQVHGVLVVPSLHRVYATATGANMVVRPTIRPTTRSGQPTSPAGQKPSSTPPPARPGARCVWVGRRATSPMTRPRATSW
jgi:hypothetical protein